MDINRSEVDRIAALARLRFSEDETMRLASEMTQILEYMSILDEVDTTGVPTTPQDTEEANRLRSDVAVSAEGRSLLEQAASRDGDHLSVPGVFQSTPGDSPSTPGDSPSAHRDSQKREP